MLLLLTLAVLLAVATGAGFIGSLAGLGGGIVLVPVLVLFFQVPFADAVGASAISVLATSTTTGAAYIHDHLTDLRIGNFLQIATVPGAMLGATLTVLVAHLNLVPILLVILALVLLSPLPGSFAMRHEELPPAVESDALGRRFGLAGSYYDRTHQRAVTYRGERTVSALEVMFGAGVIAGMFGIGSGVLKVLALDREMRLPMKVSTATSNLMIGVTATAGVGVLLVAGYVNPILAAPVAIGTTVGSFVGSRILVGLHNRTVRLVFIPVLVILAVETLLRGLSGLGVF